MNMPLIDNWINGQSKPAESANYFDVLNPIDDSVLARAADSDRSDVDAAVESAAKAFQTYRQLGPSQREKLLISAAAELERRSDDFVTWLIEEVGSAITKAKREIETSVRILRAAAGATRYLTGKTLPSDVAGRWSMSTRRPIGVVAGITPFNVPLIKTVKHCAMPLATGNTVVLLPSMHAPMVATQFASLLSDVGFPPGALNIVTGNGHKIGDALTSHPKVKFVSFTGSCQVGETIRANCGRVGKRVLLELGGKNAVVVMNDADIDRAVKECAVASFLYQGQICMSSSRLYVSQEVFEPFVEKFLNFASRLSMGDLRDPQTVIGPIINQRQRDRIMLHLDDAVSKGARILTGGNWTGNVLNPTVLADVCKGMHINDEETFGPVTSVHAIESFDEAIAAVNDSSFGLSAGIFTRNLDQAMEFADRVEVGMVHVNGSTLQEEPHVPFGGVKNSGDGRESTDAEIAQFTQWKWITFNAS